MINNCPKKYAHAMVFLHRRGNEFFPQRRELAPKEVQYCRLEVRGNFLNWP